MSLNNVSSIYKSLLSSLNAKNAAASAKNTNTKAAASTTAAEAVGTATGKKNSTTESITDRLELLSGTTDYESYLNYGQKGKYSQPTLADYLSESDSSEESSDLSSLLGESSENEDSGIFDSLIESRTAQTNLLIEQAMEKLNASKKK